VPIYDYVCSSCATRTEFIHGIDAPAPRFCPTCGAEDTLRKVFVPPAVHFKGSGWAKKDRSSSSSKTKAAAAAGSGDGTSSTSSGDGGGTAAEGDSASSKKTTGASTDKSSSAKSAET
jgi:putative FmdB family regulatory protein